MSVRTLAGLMARTVGCGSKAVDLYTRAVMEDRLEGQYRIRFEEEDRARQAVWAVLIDSWFQRYFCADDSVLDLGCGWGPFINQVQARERYAIDLNPGAVDHIESGIELFRQRADEPWPLDESSLDLVFTSNFLEHLPDRAAVMRTLDEARRCLKPGGRLVCLGPNIRLVGGAYWDFFDHLVPLSERSLAEAVELGGLRVDECRGRFLPYTMAGKRRPPAPLIRAYLKIRPAWWLLGRQFLVVASKE